MQENSPVVFLVGFAVVSGALVAAGLSLTARNLTSLRKKSASGVALPPGESELRLSYPASIYSKGGILVTSAVGLFLIVFSLAVSAYMLNDEDLLKILAVACLFTLGGLTLILIAANATSSWVTIRVSEGLIEHRKRNLFGQKQIKESVSSFRCVTPERVVETESFGNSKNRRQYNVLYARLVHRSDSRKSIVVRLRASHYASGSDVEDYSAVRKLAERLNLPVSED